MSGVAALQHGERVVPEGLSVRRQPEFPFPDNLISNLSEDEMERYAYLYRRDDPVLTCCMGLVGAAQEEMDLAEERADAAEDEAQEFEAAHDKLAVKVDQLKDRSRDLLAAMKALDDQGRLYRSDRLDDLMKALREAAQ